MDDKYLNVYYDEFKIKKAELDKQQEEADKVRKIVAKDLETIGKALLPILHDIEQTYTVQTGVKPRKDYEELNINYRGRRLISYIYSYNKHEEDNYKYVLEVDSDSELPNLFIKYYDEDNYYYQEDMYHRSVNKQEYISHPYESPGNKVKENNLDKVIEKHVKYIANYVAEDVHGLRV